MMWTFVLSGWPGSQALVVLVLPESSVTRVSATDRTPGTAASSSCSCSVQLRASDPAS